jgi:multicomponent Na+:H+ antiporter subunit G
MRPAAELIIFAGSALIFVASIGLHRFPDVFARLHAAGKATSLGFALVAIGAIPAGLPIQVWGELLLTVVVMVLTTPVGVHMLTRAAHRSGDQLSESTATDELALSGTQR